VGSEKNAACGAAKERLATPERGYRTRSTFVKKKKKGKKKCALRHNQTDRENNGWPIVQKEDPQKMRLPKKMFRGDNGRKGMDTAVKSFTRGRFKNSIAFYEGEGKGKNG